MRLRRDASLGVAVDVVVPHLDSQLARMVMVRVADQEAVSGGACGDAVYERPVDIRSNSAERELPGVAEVTRDRDQPDRTEKDEAEDGGKKTAE